MRAAAEDLDLGIGRVTGRPCASHAHVASPAARAAASRLASDSADDRVAAQSRLVRRAVGGDQCTIDLRLIGNVEPDERARQRSLHILDGTIHAVTAEGRSARRAGRRPRGAAGRTGGRDAAADGATGEPHFGLDGRVAARA